MAKQLSLETCMDILDWYEDDSFRYASHIYLSKSDGEQRLRPLLPAIRKRAALLLKAHRGTEEAYPQKLLNFPA